jgi:crossover junction endodeoxyribonuclease RuvC
VLTLGIDPSLDRTGYAVLDDALRRVIDAGVLRTTPRGGLAARLAELAAALDEVLEEHAVRRVAVEDLYAHYRHPRTAILMGHARGVILLAAARRGIAVETYSATRIKKSLTGNGHAGKRQVQRAIVATLGLARVPEPPDVADAIAAALCAIDAGGRSR